MHLPGLFKEIDGLESNGVSCEGRILVSDRAHLLFDFHQQVDGLREAELAKSFIGTTRRGIGPCYSSKVIRNGIRVSDLRHMDTFPQKLDILLSDAASRFQGFNYGPEMLRDEVEIYKRFAERLEPFIADTVHVMNESIVQKKKILVEGGQATMLDIDFGTYPFVTSSSPSAGGICTGLGIAPRVVGDLIGVVSRYLLNYLVYLFFFFISFSSALPFFFGRCLKNTSRNLDLQCSRVFWQIYLPCLVEKP